MEQRKMLESPAGSKRTVVGIGASAGGLGALKTFFKHVPKRCGISFVVVVHLSPEHESHLAELLQPHTGFPVQQVSQTTVLEPDHVYVIPPNANISTIDTHLRLSKLEERRQERAPVDHFLRAVAKTHDGNAVAVILTGTGSDGTLGIRDIKESGGLVIVQDPAEAEYDGMPQSAAATGMVDLILPVAEIPDAILRYAATQPRVVVPSEGEDLSHNQETLLQKVFAQLRARTDRDFSRYKRSTILRRVTRRMQLNYLEDLPKYLEHLRERPEEVRALADDLLITVTHFFRDSEVFEKLEKDILPSMFKNAGPNGTLRAWSVGCATGEEAYSLAVMLTEEAGRHEPPPQVQVFASDLHTRSLERAREGFYPGDIATDISPERLKRFFVKENGGYRVQKELRDRVIFAPHNILADPPFSRLDLISCRNLLIYLERDVQRDVI
jgi:two-component system, chemotaxis family, CheB/CheR fusion protein